MMTINYQDSQSNVPNKLTLNKFSAYKTTPNNHVINTVDNYRRKRILHN